MLLGLMRDSTGLSRNLKSGLEFKLRAETGWFVGIVGGEGEEQQEEEEALSEPNKVALLVAFAFAVVLLVTGVEKSLAML